MNSAALEAPESCKVYTPDLLANAIVEFLVSDEKMTWLEPGCGAGAFLSALHKHGIPRDQITALDIDTKPQPADDYAEALRGIDFLDWASEHHETFDRIVGNPPYASIRFLSGSLRERAARVPNVEGNAIGYRANTWYAFALESVRCLKPGGSMALILPASSEFSDYAEIGRSKLTGLFDRIDVVRSQSPLFDGVQEGSVILFARNKGGDSARFRRHVVRDLDAVLAKIRELDSFPARKCPAISDTVRSEHLTLLSDVMEIRLGGVTGDAKYFLLSEEERVSNGLPKRALSRVLSRSHHIRCSNITERDWQRLANGNEKSWLFRPSGKILENRAVRKYLNYGKKGGCNMDAYKVSSRDPWYVTPLPDVVDAFITGMSTQGVWLCMNEMRKVNATNTLYVLRFLEETTRAQRYAWAISLLSSTAVKQVERGTRIYPDGLKKIEPGQISKLQLPTPGMIRNAVSIYARICKLYLSGNKREALGLADETISKSQLPI